jgi:hypothetical protein
VAHRLHQGVEDVPATGGGRFEPLQGGGRVGGVAGVKVG